jgi:hypothetical protein
MSKLPRLLFQSPILDEETDKARVIRTFDAISLVVVASLGLICVGIVFIVQRKAAVAVFTLAMLALFLVSRAVLRSGRVYLACIVLVSGL